jgi:hypothetical protein
VRLTFLFVASAIATASAQQANDAASIDRVKRALARPPSALNLQERPPDFRVEIIDRQRFEHLLGQLFETKGGTEPPPGVFARAPTVGTTPPLIGVDLLAIGRSLGNAVSGAGHDRDARAAAEEMWREVASYCAAQPDRATIQICSGHR